MPLSRTFLVAIAAFALAASPAAAQTPLADSLRGRIDSVFARWDHTDTPGCALGISMGGVVAYERGYGTPLPAPGIDTVARVVSAATRSRWVGTYRDPVTQGVIRNKAKRIDGFTLTDGRTRGVRFDRVGPASK